MRRPRQTRACQWAFGRPCRRCEHTGDLPRNLRGEEGVHIRAGNPGADPGAGVSGSSPPFSVAGVHRQRRRPVGPHQGLRQGPCRQWRPGGLLVDGGPGGLAS